MKKTLLFFLCVLISNLSFGQDLVLFNGERMDSLPDKNWYAVNNQSQIISRAPQINFVEDVESDMEGNFISVNHETVVLFSTNKKIDHKSFLILSEKLRWMKNESVIHLNNEFYLKGNIQQIAQDKIFSLFIGEVKTKLEYEVFRNCRVAIGLNTYYGCGRLPMHVDFVGDIINDGKPEIVLSSAKEGGSLKLILGYHDGKYQVLRATEFD